MMTQEEAYNTMLGMQGQRVRICLTLTDIDPGGTIELDMAGTLEWNDETDDFYATGMDCDIDVPAWAVKDIWTIPKDIPRIRLGNFKASA